MSEFKYACPVCGQHVICDSSQAGSVLECPTCFQKITVPQAPASDEQKFIITGTKVGAAGPKVLEGDSSPVRTRKTMPWVAALIFGAGRVRGGRLFYGMEIFRPTHWQSGDVGDVSAAGRSETGQRRDDHQR